MLLYVFVGMQVVLCADNSFTIRGWGVITSCNNFSVSTIIVQMIKNTNYIKPIMSSAILFLNFPKYMPQLQIKKFNK